MANKFTTLIRRLLLIVSFTFTGYQGLAQYTATTLSTGGAYTAMAKDQSDNIYVVRYNGTNYEVAKYAGGNPASTTVIYTGLSSGGGSDIYSWGLAVNSHGDVFVTNAYQPAGWQIIKLTAPLYTSSVIQSGNYYSALAVDAADNLLSMEYNAAGSGNGTYRLVRYPAGSESAAGTTLYDGFSYPNGGLSYPWGIVTDSHRNIFLLDFLENSGGRLVKLTYPGYAATVLSASKSFTSLAIDAGDNIYTCEKIDAATAKVVKYTDPAVAGTVLYSGLTNASLFYPWGLAVNSSGQIFVNDGAASGNGRVLRLDPPASLVSSVVRAAGSPVNTTSVTYTVTFNKAVTGVTTASFSLTTTGVTGASIASVSGSGATYTVVVNTGSGDGTIRLNVTGTGITPATTNVPYTTGEVYRIDKTSPTGSLSINGGATVTSNTTVALTTSATDASAIQMRFSNNGTSWSAYEALAAGKSWAMPAGDGLKTVYVQYSDAAGNTVSYSQSITLDQTDPETTITGGPANPTNSQLTTFSFSSNEVGAGFQYSLDGSGFITIPGASPYSFSGVPEGTHTMKIAAKDAAGNVDATPDSYTWTVDLTSPAVTSVSVPANGYYKAGDALTFTVNYTENVVTAGSPYLDVIMNSGNVKANYLSGSGTGALTFRYIAVDGDLDLDGIAIGTQVQLNGGTIKDAAGNAGLTALQNAGSTSGVFVNATKPTVTLTTSDPAVLNHSITCKATFSEAVTGFIAADIHVTNGTVSALSTSDNITYNITVTPTAGGAVTIDVPAAVAQSIAGNNNQVSNTLTFTYDITKPVVTSVAVPADGYYKAGDQLNFTATFSEIVVLDTTGSKPFISVTIGAASVNAVLSGATGTTLTFTYTVVTGDKDLNGVTVGSLSLNGSTIKDSAGNNATLTLNNAGSTANVKVSTDMPSVTLSAPAVVNGAYTATITFSEAVTGFTAGDVTVGNGVAGNMATTNNIVFTVTITPSAEGLVTLNVGANAATNISGNGNTAATPVSTTYDVTLPVVAGVLVPANGYYKAGDKLNFTVTFSEPVSATGTPYLTATIGSSVVNAALISSTDSSLTFSYTVADGDQDMDGIAPGTLTGTIKDAAGNNATLTLHHIGATTGVFVNTTHAATVVSTTAATTINAPYTAKITFSEAVTGFVQGDITVSNATLSNLVTTDNITYTVLVTPLADGNVTLSVPANVAVNIGNNGNNVSNTLTNVYDATAPTVTSVDVPANGYYKDGTTLDFTVHFSESVRIDSSVAKPYINIVIGSTTVKALYHNMPSAGVVNFSYTVLPGQTDLDGIAVGALSGSMADAAGNTAVLTLNNVSSTANVFVKTSAPAVVLSATAAAHVNAPFTVKATFSEAVTGFIAADVHVTNGTVSALSTADNINYNITVTPIADGTVTIDVPAAVAQSIVGNNNNQASNTLSFTYDITKPVVTSVAVPADGYYKAGDQLNFTATFSEIVVLDTTGSKPFISVTIGAASVNAVLSGATGTTLTFTYTVVTGDKDLNGVTVGSLSLNGSTIKDSAGNNATLTLNNAGSTANVKVSTDMPSVTLSAPAVVNGAYTATITFSEAVTGFTAGDVTVGNGVAGNMATTNNIVFTVTITPSAEGLVTLNVGANAATNISGNGNTAATPVSTTYDVTLPVVAGVLVPANGYYKAGDKLNFTVTFSEPVSATGTPYLTATIGSSVVNAALISSTDSSLTFSYTVADGDQDMDGITPGTLTGTIKDAAGNNATLTLHHIGATTGVFVNTTHAATVVSTTAATTINAPYTAKITFSEAVTGFVQGDITVSNATLSNLVTTDNITYTVLVTPLADGNVTLSVPANVAVNIGNNGNNVSNTLTNVYDATAPTITSVDVPANGYYKDGTALDFTVHFSESIRIDSSVAKPYINIVIGSTTVKALYHNMPSAGVVNFSYTVLPGQTDLDGIAVGALSGSMADAAGNTAVLTLNNVSSTANVFVKTSAPAVVLSATAAARVNALFTVKAVFSEAVTGLTAGDFAVTNGTASNLQTTDNITYTIDITPAADGTVSIYLPAGMAVNVVNNGNTVSDTVKRVYDITAPLITAGQAFTTSEKSPVGTLVGNVTAVETVGTLQNWTITNDGSGGAFSIDNTGAIYVKNTAILKSNANNTVNVTITVSDGLNTSIAQSVAITIRFVNQAPVLDEIKNIVLCMDTETHTVQLTGASAVETDQTYSLSVSADKPDFDVLSVNAAGMLTYRLKPNTSGIITVTVTIKDNGGTSDGGVDTSLHTFTVTVNSLPVAGISSDKGTTISKGDVVALTATGGSTYLWNSGETTGRVEAKPMTNTTYKVTVTNAEGCKDTAEITIKVVEDFKIEAVNILTPNGDGKNDRWVIRNLESYPNNEVKIYDRTGRIVYVRRNYSNDWDGTMNGSPLAEGTYYYILTIDGGKTAKGFITIIRGRN